MTPQLNLVTALPLILLVCIEYTGVLIAVIADLFIGLRKSILSGSKCTSWGLRRTVDKLSRYYFALFALTIVDAMYVTASLVLTAQGVNLLPTFPFLTTFGAIGLALIEVKSILEEVNEKGDISMAATLLKDLLSRLPKK